MGVSNGNIRRNHKTDDESQSQLNKPILKNKYKNSLVKSSILSNLSFQSEEDDPIIVIRFNPNKKTEPRKIETPLISNSENNIINSTNLIIINQHNNLDQSYISISPIEDEKEKINDKEDKKIMENQRYLENKELNKDENDKKESNIKNSKESKKLNLRNLINNYKKNKKFMSENLILIILREICSEIKRKKLKNIVYLDINPDKIYISDEFNIKIEELNYPEILDDNDIKNSITHNFKYHAPEMLKSNGDIPLDKSYMWSLGCVLYELCQKKSCFKYDKNKIEYFKNIKKKKNIKLNKKYKNLNKLINNLLVIDINDRYDINQVCKNIKELYLKPENYDEFDELSRNIFKRLDKNNLELTIDTSIKIKVEEKEKNDSEKDKNYFEIDENQMKINELEYSEITIDGEKKEKQDKYDLEKGKHRILLEFEKNFENCFKLFYNCQKIINIDFYLFNTSEVKEMSYMLSYCKNLKKLDLSNLNTLNVEKINNMFSFCENLEELDLSTLDTRQIKEMESLFDNCLRLKKINLLFINTKNVNKMGKMFNNCINLNYLDLSSFDTTNVKNMDSMFLSCREIKMLDLSNFNTKNLETINNMFSGCENMNILDISYFNTLKVKSELNNIFNNCYNLKKIIINNKEINKKPNIFTNSNIKGNIINLKLTLAYKSLIDLFIYKFQLKEKSSLKHKKKIIERHLLKNKDIYSEKINQLLEDLLELIENYDYDEFNIDFKKKNIIEQIIKNIGEYKGNDNYQEIIEIMNKFEIDDLLKKLIELREDKFKDKFKEEELNIIKKIKEKFQLKNGCF